MSARPPAWVPRSSPPRPMASGPRISSSTAISTSSWASEPGRPATKQRYPCSRTTAMAHSACYSPSQAPTDLRDFVWADLDQDGDPDAALLDARGEVRVYANERTGRFQPRIGNLNQLDTIVALGVADVYSDGKMDLLLLRTSGTIVRATARDEGTDWELDGVTPALGNVSGSPRLFVADLDNNGAVDMIVSGKGGTSIGLGDKSRRFHMLRASSGIRVLDVADLDADGRLDLVGLSAEGRPTLGIVQGKKAYHWQVIRPRAAQVFGDGRINSFGLGGEVEVRSGLLVQKQVINGPVLHFGLGDRPRLDVARIVWPNGTVQAEFDAKAEQDVTVVQRLKGSCPFLFAFDGAAVRFVTDFIWRSPLGLRINAQDTAGIGQTEDWVKIRGDQLASRDGAYDVRITAELWETHYFDHVSLMVVDHPAGTEIFVDERFAREPPPLAAIPTGPLYPVTKARDDQGRDVLDKVASPRWPIPRRLWPRLLPGGHARPLGRGRARRRGSARQASLAGCTRLDSSHRQLDQRGHRPGQERPATGAGSGSPDRGRKLDRRAGETWDFQPARTRRSSST